MIDINWLRQQSLMDNFGQPPDGGDYSMDTSNLFDDPSQQDSQYDPAFRDVTFPSQGANEMPGQIRPPSVAPVPSYAKPAQPPVDPNDPYGLIKMTNQIYTPETAANDRLSKLLDQAPDYQHYNPGILRGIGGIGLALGPGGYKASQEMMYAPIARDMAAWKEEAAPFQAAATAENARNINERTMAGNIATSTVNARRADAQQAATDARTAETERHNRETEAYNKIKGDALLFKQQHPDWKFDATGPYVIAMDPQDPTKSYNTGVKTENMSAMEKVMWNTMSGMMIKATSPGVVPTPEPGPPKPGDLPKLTARSLEEQYVTDPTAAKYIDFNQETGKYTMKQRPVISPGGWFSDPVTQQNVDEWMAVAKKAYPESFPAPAAPAGGGVKVGDRVGNNQPPPPVTDPGLHQRAAAYLTAHGKAATEGNIAVAVQQGWVK